MSLAERLQSLAVNTVISAGVALGHNLCLFHALAEVGNKDKPAKPAKVAEKANCKTRYVEEWLCLMASADIIEVNENEEFWIAPKNEEVLCTNSLGTTLSVNIMELMGPYKDLVNVVKKSGPLGLSYSHFDGFYQMMAKFSEAMHKEHFISEFVPKVADDFEKRLKEGGVLCLDVGCGNGFHSHLLAKEFSKSNFVGVDISAEAIEVANQKSKSNGETLKNASFYQMDAGNLSKDWNNRYDAVFIIDACHDQMRPDLCLSEVYRVLKPGGVLAMLETRGTSNVYMDKQELGPMATLLYGFSMFHCLPVGSNSEDAMCAGAAWGREMAQKLLRNAGFEDIEVLPTPNFAINQLYVCRK